MESLTKLRPVTSNLLTPFFYQSPMKSWRLHKRRSLFIRCSLCSIRYWAPWWHDVSSSKELLLLTSRFWTNHFSTRSVKWQGSTESGCVTCCNATRYFGSRPTWNCSTFSGVNPWMRSSSRSLSSRQYRNWLRTTTRKFTGKKSFWSHLSSSLTKPTCFTRWECSFYFKSTLSPPWTMHNSCQNSSSSAFIPNSIPPSIPSSLNNATSTSTTDKSCSYAATMLIRRTQTHTVTSTWTRLKKEWNKNTCWLSRWSWQTSKRAKIPSTTIAASRMNSFWNPSWASSNSSKSSTTNPTKWSSLTSSTWWWSLDSTATWWAKIRKLTWGEWLKCLPHGKKPNRKIKSIINPMNSRIYACWKKPSAMKFMSHQSMRKKWSSKSTWNSRGLHLSAVLESSLSKWLRKSKT